MGKAVSDVDLDSLGVITLFEGQGVIESAVEVRNLSGGLNEAHETEPRIGQIGDTGSITFRYEIIEVDHKPVKPKAYREGDEGMLRRVHVMRAFDVTYIDTDLVREALDAQAVKNAALARAKEISAEKRAGVQRIVPDDGTPGPAKAAGATKKAPEKKGPGAPRATRPRGTAATKKNAASVTDIGAGKKSK
jgi:hypothetical protein